MLTLDARTPFIDPEDYADGAPSTAERRQQGPDKP